jgi:hypothetical protein
MIFQKRAQDERGLALITVVVASTVLMLLATVLVASAQSSSNISRHDQDWNAALAGAEAGIDDYVFRLNENSNYWQYNAGNPPPASDPNPAFSSYVPVAGAATATEAEFRYSTDVSSLNVDGRIRITSTGRVRDTTRTVHATLRRRSFLDFLYFTDIEARDPQQYNGNPFDQATAQTRCGTPLHYYGPLSTTATPLRRDVDDRTDYAGDSDADPSGSLGPQYCTEITFISADSVNGPLHTNDAFRVCGSPNFNGDTSTSWDGLSGGGTGVRYRQMCTGSGDPDFANTGDPAFADPLLMPPSNSAIRNETNPGRGGCLYTGPTRIRLQSNGTMTVRSPYSKQTNNGCVTNGNGPLPSNGVIYVQNVPTSTTDANGWTGTCPNSSYNSGSGVWQPASGSYSGPAHPLGFPLSGDITPYGCRDGDAFVEGALDGQLTIAAQNNVVVTWHLTYDDGFAGNPADLLGLVANNFIYTYHPVDGSGDNIDASIPTRGRFPSETSRGSALNNANINAAILSVNHSFGVQNYSDGSPLGSLTVNGAIAQRYRGIVGQFNGSGNIVHGYAKNYVYDQRLKYLSPPKFLDPVAAAWGVNTWAEVDTPAGL